MKHFLLIAALLLQAPSSQGPRGSVTGRVIVSGTSEPINEADVAIVTPEGVLETTTDASGRFGLANVPTGRQTVVLRADGFFVESTAPNSPFAARAEVPVTVTAGETPIAIPNVTMVQSGTISGKVVDPQGSPLPFIRVQALRPDAGTLNSGVVPDFASRMTDDRGEYRMFFVPPGEYVIRAQVQGGRPAGPVQPRPGEIQTLVSTLFPNTTDMAQASKVIVKSGEEVRGIDISVKMELVTLPPPEPKPTGGFKISGVVVDRVLPWVGEAVLMLGSEADAGAPRQVGTAIIGGTPGDFEIPSVPPGKYDLFARMPNADGSPGPGGAIQAWGRTTVEVVDHDVENIRIVLHPSMDVPGVVKIDGKLAPEGGTLKIGLSPTGTASRIGNYRGILDRTQSPDASGKVTIPRAAEGNYQVFVQGADNIFVADVRQGDTSILTAGIDVRSATPAPFEVLLSSNGGTVEGVVSNTDKSPMGGATVLLFSADKQLPSLNKTTTAGADGKYQLRGVRPGEYKVIAGPPGSLPPGGLTSELLSRVESRGVSVTVKAATSTRIDVEAMTN
jgi:protocatechuate 3,4-dioxygenase beta subunit